MGYKHKIGVMFFQCPFANLPLMLWLHVGLMWSAEQAADEEGAEISKGEYAFTILISVGMAVLFFIALPYLATQLIGFREEQSPLIFNIIDGIIRIAVFLLYIISISRIKDIKRLFQYHGAEHMAVHCYEKGKKLTAENVKKFPTLHPRCGTSFILIVLVMSIFVFSLVPPIILYFWPEFISYHIFARKGMLFLLRLLMLPLIAGISYELLKLSDRHQRNFLVRAFIMPGLWLQMITTKKPDRGQIEVAIKSAQTVLSLEKQKNF